MRLPVTADTQAAGQSRMTPLQNDKPVRPTVLQNGLAGVRRFAKTIGQVVAGRLASSLTRRILVLNLAGLVVLLVGLLYVNQFREGLIEARVQSLQTQGEIIASAIAASATVETDTIAIDPDRLLQLQAGESSGLADDLQSILEFSINPERVGPLLRRLVTPTRTRARVYDREGFLVIDSGTLYARGDILRRDLAPVVRDDIPMIERSWNSLAPPSGACGDLEHRRNRHHSWQVDSQRYRGPCRVSNAASCGSMRSATPLSRWLFRSSASATCGARCCCRPRAATLMP
jgi:hypothetical protein